MNKINNKNINKQLLFVQNKYNCLVDILNVKNDFKGFVFDVKTSYEYTNTKFNASFSLMENNLGVRKSMLIKLLEANNCVMSSTTISDSLCVGSTGDKSFYGKVINPWKHGTTNAIVGGSSSGAAVMASVFSDFSLGTDTGGSCRNPALLCGIVGFKPSIGRFSRDGIYEYQSEFDCPGILSRKIEIIEKIYNILNVQDPKDPLSFNRDNEKIIFKYKNKIKIGFLFFKNEKHSKVLNFLNKLCKHNNNFEVELIEINDFDPEVVNGVYEVISSVGVYSNIRRFDSIKYGKNFSNFKTIDCIYNKVHLEIENHLKNKVKFANEVLKDNDIYIKAHKIRRFIYLKCKQFFKQYDCLITNGFFDENTNPTNPNEVWLYIANFIGSPSLSMPFDVYKESPIGINLICNFKDDKKLLFISRKIEIFADFYNKHFIKNCTEIRKLKIEENYNNEK